MTAEGPDQRKRTRREGRVVEVAHQYASVAETIRR